MVKKIFLGILFLIINNSNSDSDSKSSTPFPWKLLHEKLTLQRDTLFSNLDSIQKNLLASAISKKDSNLIKRLKKSPPKPRIFGYQILPSIYNDKKYSPTQPSENRYPLRYLENLLKNESKKVAGFFAKLKLKIPFKSFLIDSLDSFKKSAKYIEDLLDYHGHWQKIFPENKEYFTAKNITVAKVKLMKILKVKEKKDSLNREISFETAPFYKTDSLIICKHSSGKKILKVSVLTDINDSIFINNFITAVDSHYNKSKAFQLQGLRIKLLMKRINSHELYSNDPPEVGTHLDIKKHLSKFPKNNLILTTGGRSTYAKIGRHIILGPSPLNLHTLAHEFGHLLGFSDAYLRGFEGNISGPYGVIFVEWIGLFDDLMGNSHSGIVSSEMTNILLKNYSGQCAGE